MSKHTPGPWIGSGPSFSGAHLKAGSLYQRKLI
jgi:hypothetical protein